MLNWKIPRYIFGGLANSINKNQASESLTN